MKIAFVVGKFPEISETFILNQIVYLIDAGHEVDVLAFSKSSTSSAVHENVNKYKLLENVRYFTRPTKGYKRLAYFLGICILNIFQIYKILKLLSAQKSFDKKLDDVYISRPFLKKKYDVVFCHFGTIAKNIIFLKTIFPKLSIVTVFHGYDVSKVIKKKGVAFYRELFEKGDLFLPISDFWKKKIEHLGVSEDKVKVHHMGVDPEKFVYRKVDAAKKPLVLATIGRLTEKKAHSYIIKAINKLKDKYKLTYIIAGDGELKNELMDQVNYLGLKDIVRFVGSIDEKQVKKLYSQMNIFLLPSITAKSGDQEGIPVVLMEAMMAGVPVVSTYHTGIPELIEHKKTGMLVEEKDVEGIVKAVEYIIGNPDNTARMCEQASDFVKQYFNNKLLNADLEDLLVKQSDVQNG